MGDVEEKEREILLLYLLNNVMSLSGSEDNRDVLTSQSETAEALTHQSKDTRDRNNRRNNPVTQSNHSGRGDGKNQHDAGKQNNKKKKSISEKRAREHRSRMRA